MPLRPPQQRLSGTPPQVQAEPTDAEPTLTLMPPNIFKSLLLKGINLFLVSSEGCCSSRGVQSLGVQYGPLNG